jgi:hypothetical protein
MKTSVMRYFARRRTGLPCTQRQIEVKKRSPDKYIQNEQDTEEYFEGVNGKNRDRL